MKLSIGDCICRKNKLIFIAREVNVIASLNLNSGKIQLLDKIPEKDIFSENLSFKMLQWKKKLIFIPINNNKIWIFNTDTKTWKKIELEPSDNGEILFLFQAIIYKEKLFVLGGIYSKIVVVNLEDESFIYIENVFEILQEKRKLYQDSYIRYDYVQKKNHIYMASCLSNCVLDFDMDTFYYEWKNVGGTENRYSGIAWDGKYFWLAPRHDTPIVRWNGKEDVVEYLLPQECTGKNWTYLNVIAMDDNIMLIGNPESKSLIFDKKSKYNIKEEQLIFYRKYTNGSVISQEMNGILTIAKKNKKTKRYKCKIDKKSFMFFLENQGEGFLEQLKKNQIETSIFNLENLCIGMTLLEKDENEKRRKYNFGKRVWSQFREKYE